MIRAARLPAVFLAATLASAALWVACGDDAPATAPSCVGDPLACAAGTTCWPTVGGTSSASACLPSKSYKVRGDDCELIPGDPSCGDGMVCATAATLKGDGSLVQSFCAGYCNAGGGGCQGDETCMKLALVEGGPTVSVCVPRSLPRDHAKDGGM